MKRIILLSLFFLLPSSLFIVNAASSNVGGVNYTYDINDNAAIITDMAGDIPADLNIPATLGGYAVTTIAWTDDANWTENDNSKNALHSITFPNTLTSLTSEFMGAFSGCANLVRATLPVSLTTLADYAFDGCRSLDTLIFLGATPPALIGGNHFPTHGAFRIYVNDANVGDYKTAWASIANRILPMGGLVTYYVTFNYHYDPEPSPEPTIVSVQGSFTVPKPANPIREGYVFDGWWGIPFHLYDFESLVASNFTLYAYWTSGYTVTFDAQGGEPAPAPQTVTHGSAITEPVPAPEREDFVFDGWHTDPAKLNYYNFLSAFIDSSFTLYAHWKATNVEYAITFDANYINNGSSIFARQSVTEGALLLPPNPLPTRPGYTFAGWHTDPVNPSFYAFENPVTANFTLYAHWQEAPASSSASTIHCSLFTVHYYCDLQGRRIAYPQSGRLYIIIYGNGERQLIMYH